MSSKDDNDRLLDGTLPIDPADDADPVNVDDEEDVDEVLQKVAAPYQPFPIEALPEPLSTFVAESAAAIRCEPAFIALPLLAGIAAAVGNTRRVQLKRRWTEPAVIWSGIVGYSGSLKSPAVQIALEALKRTQSRAFKKHAEEMQRFRIADERYKLAMREWQRDQSGVRPDQPKAPTAWRIICGDATVEALAPRLLENPRGLLMARDELSGWVRSFNQYKGGRGADAAHWLEMFRAGDILVDRKVGVSVISVPRAAVSVTGSIQPGVLKRSFGREHLENGLAARLLLAMPPRRVKQWSDEDISVQSLSALATVYERLIALSFGLDDDGDPTPIDLPLLDGAKAAWIAFYDAHALEQVGLDDDLAAVWSKLEGYTARLALLIHLVRWVWRDPTLETSEAIDARSVSMAITLTRWFAREAQRIYAALALTPADDSGSDLLTIVRRRDGVISPRGLMHASRQYRDSVEIARRALQEHIDAGFGRWEKRLVGKMKPRLVEVFVLSGTPPATTNPGNAVTPVTVTREPA